MPLGEKAWEGDPSRLVSPDTGLRATRRKCRGEADTECSTRLVITFVHLVSFLLRAVPIFVRRLAGTLVGQKEKSRFIHVVHWQSARSRWLLQFQPLQLSPMKSIPGPRRSS